MIRGPFARTSFLLGLGLILYFITVMITRPLMPVDETRYFTVAWEMWHQGHFFLPTLNYEPYSHKPPLLFWLIQAGWSVFGVSVWPARVLIFCVLAGVLFGTARLARTLLPDMPHLQSAAALLLAGSPLFLVYGGMIMFDALLTLWVLLSLIAIWQAAHTRSIQSWLLFGLALGGGLLTKGPVALVYMLPAALFMPLWATDSYGQRAAWYGRVVCTVLMGAAIVLSWAIPAAILGGEAYAQKIFVTQSAGRMVQAFDHARPWWFYLPFVAAFCAPYILWPRAWVATRDFVRASKAPSDVKVIKFLACATLPVLLFFSAISSKQVHYLLPLLPCVAVFLALVFARCTRPDNSSALIPVLVGSALSGVMLIDYALKGPISTLLFGLHPAMAAGHVVAGAALAWVVMRRPQWQMHTLAAASIMLVCMLHIQAGHSKLDRYDLTDVGNALQAQAGRPLAVSPKYDGEYGYVGRLTTPMTVLQPAAIQDWLTQTPNGVVLVRFRDEKDLDAYNVLYETHFRVNQGIALVEKRP